MNTIFEIMHFSSSIKLSMTLISIFILVTLQIVSAQDQLFKISKLNTLWAKAQHSLGPAKLKDLGNDLIKHELDQMSLKKMKAHNQDKDGLFEATVRRNLHSIMAKYSLERFYDDIHPSIDTESHVKKDNLEKVKSKGSESLSDLKSTFRDKKLNKLWRKAEQSGFTQEQLMVLYEEFEHTQEKLDGHYETMNLIEEELNANARKAERRSNSLDDIIEEDSKPMKAKKIKESAAEKKARLGSDNQQALKEKYSDIKKGIDQLHKKIISGQLDESARPFEEGPVNELWAAAVQANFTDSELDSFREELEHYQTRVKKLNHFQMELERNKIGGPKESSLSADSEELDSETKHIRRRVSDLAYKVKKTHLSLEKKIASRKDEL